MGLKKICVLGGLRAWPTILFFSKRERKKERKKESGKEREEKREKKNERGKKRKEKKEREAVRKTELVLLYGLV